MYLVQPHLFIIKESPCKTLYSFIFSVLQYSIQNIHTHMLLVIHFTAESDGPFPAVYLISGVTQEQEC